MTDSTLKSTLRSDLHDAIRSQDKVRSGTLRMTLTAITNAEVAGTEAKDLSDDEVLKVIAKEAKKRKEASTAYVGAGRPELAGLLSKIVENEGAALGVFFVIAMIFVVLTLPIGIAATRLSERLAVKR